MKHLAYALLISVISLPAVAQESVLKLVSGKATQEFTLADLDALPQIKFSTTTIWTEGKITFSGVPLAAILASTSTNTSAKTVRLTALDNYAIDIPRAEISENYPLVATRINGESMKMHDKGPYWVVYPYDADAQYQTKLTQARSIWQLAVISVVP